MPVRESANHSGLPGEREDLVLIAEAARQAGKIALGYFGNNPEVWLKEGDSPVSEADHAVDRYLREHLMTARPNYGWMSEETEDNARRLSCDKVFVVDPVDGTKGFIQGLQKWCVSIAVVHNGRPVCAVLECPVLQESYIASTGGGSWLNGNRIAPPAAGNGRLRIAGPQAMVKRHVEYTGQQSERVSFIPSLAYRLANVASGALDGAFAKANACDWDIAAVDLIMLESGASFTGLDGREIIYNRSLVTHNTLVAARGELFCSMLNAARLESGLDKL